MDKRVANAAKWRMKHFSFIGSLHVYKWLWDYPLPFSRMEILQTMFIFSFQNRRGEQTQLTYLDETRVMLKYSLPLSEIVIDFYDQLKSLSSGYARYFMKFCYSSEYCHNYCQEKVILLTHEYVA